MINIKNILGGFLAGAVLGAAAGLLMAPSSGKKTRNKLIKESRKLTDTVSSAVSSSIKDLKSGFNQKVDKYADTGSKAFGKAKEKVKL